MGEEKLAQTNPAIKDAAISQVEIRTLPVEVRTETDGLKLTVTVGVDRNKVKNGHLTAVVALFDDDGSFIAGNQGSLNLQPPSEPCNLKGQPPFQLQTALA